MKIKSVLIITTYIPILFFFTGCKHNTDTMKMNLQWNTHITLPPVNGQVNPGMAGAYTGISDHYLIVAGGACFPGAYPWDGGRKCWSKDIYILDLEEKNGKNRWQYIEGQLPRAIAYGSSVTTSKGVLCIGGCDAEECYSDTYFMKMEEGKVSFSPWIPLPYPLANCCASVIGNTIYVAGGQNTVINGSATNVFLSIDVNEPKKGWKELPTWDGPARGYAIGVAKVVNDVPCFYLFSGRNYDNDGVEVLSDAYCYNTETNQWRKLNGDFPLMAAIGGNQSDSNFVLLAGGTDGAILRKEVALREELKACAIPEKRDSLQNQLNNFLKHIEGFDNLMRWYDVEKELIVKTEEVSFSMPLTTTMVMTPESFYIPSGEVRPGVRSPLIIQGIFK